MISNLLLLAISLLEECRLLLLMSIAISSLKNWDDNGDLAYVLVMRSYFKALGKYKNV